MKRFFSSFLPLAVSLLLWALWIDSGDAGIGPAIVYLYLQFGLAVHALCARKDLPLPDVYAQILYRALTAVPVAVCFRLWMTSSIYGLLLIIVLLFAGLDLRAAMRRGDALAEDCQ